MESSGESADEAFTLNMHLAAALVGSERVEAQCPSPEERAGPRSFEYVRASYGPRFHRAVRMSEPCFAKLIDALRPHLPSSPHRVQSRSVLRRLHPLLSVPLAPPPPPPPRRRSPHRAQTKQTCGCWRDTLVMDVIDTKPADAAGRVQPLYVPCAGAPLQTAPLNAAAARRRPAATGMPFTCAHNQFTRLTKSSRQPGRPASSHGFGRVAQSRHAQDRPGEPRRVTDFNQPAFDNVRHKRYHKRLPVSRNGPERGATPALFDPLERVHPSN